MPTDAVTAVSPTPEVLKMLIGGLSAYGRLYGLPNSPEQMQGILGTLLRLYQPDRPPASIDQVAQQVLDGLTPEAIKDAIVNRASSALAKETRRWQQQLEQQVTGVLSAYVQSHVPSLTPDTLRGLATSVMPLLNDSPVTRAEAMGLVSWVMQTFNADRAIAAVIPPALMAVAQALATAVSQKPLEDAVGETVTAYVAKFAPTLVAVGEDLISQALSAVLKNQVDFGIDIDLSLIDKQLLIQQISFKLNILQQSPLPSKTAEAIAAEVDSAVQAYIRDRENQEGGLDLTLGVENPGGGLSSPWTSQGPGGGEAKDDFWEKHRS